MKRSFSNCYASKCKYHISSQFILSQFMSSLAAGSIFSIIIKEHINKELLYVKRQNEEIIERLKNN